MEVLTNKEIREKELRNNCENYRKIVFDCIELSDRNDKTIIETIQKWAKDLEEVFMLHDQQWAVCTISNNIVKSLKTVGVRQSRLDYVSEALHPFPQYSYRRNHTELVEQSRQVIVHYSDAAKFDRLKRLIQQLDSEFSPAEMERNNARDVVEMVSDLRDKMYTNLAIHKIPLIEKKQDDFHGTEDKYKEKIRYPKTVPAFTELTNAFAENIEARQKVLERLISEGRDSIEGIVLLTDDDIREIAESIRLDTYIWQPFTDKKFRKNNLQWIEIIQDSIEWFKHSASKKFKTVDIHGKYRELTREAIGGKKEEILELAHKIVKLEPKRWLLMGIWWYKTADKRGSEFSQNLSPKLSDRSIK